MLNADLEIDRLVIYQGSQYWDEYGQETLKLVEKQQSQGRCLLANGLLTVWLPLADLQPLMGGGIDPNSDDPYDQEWDPPLEIHVAYSVD